MKTIKRLAVLTGTVAVAGTLLTPSAFAATPATGVSPYNGSTTAGPGGSFGIGNCGYNNGGGRGKGPTSPTSPGLGGFTKDSCKQVQRQSPVSPAPEAQPALVEAEKTYEPVMDENFEVVLVDTTSH